MRQSITVLVLAVVIMTQSATGAERDRAEVVGQVNQDLELLAQELAVLVKAPGFRGFVRSEMAKSKNREGILELDRFLDRASRQKGMPRGLAKVHDQSRTVGRGLKSLNETFRGYDLYMPVDAHREKWRGGENVYVAVAPVDTGEPVSEIVAFSVRNGQRVVLDPKKVPEAAVLVLSIDEHDTHETPPEPKNPGPVPAERPKAQSEGRSPPERPVPQEPGNSDVGLHYLKIYKTGEEWWEGDPEIILFFGHRSGGSCIEETQKLDYVNATRTWYNTWSGAWGSQKARFPFNRAYYNKMRLEIWEQDFSLFGHIGSHLYQIYSGITCEWIPISTWDRIDFTNQYRNNFSFDRDYYHNIGDAYLVWRKEH